MMRSASRDAEVIWGPWGQGRRGGEDTTAGWDADARGFRRRRTLGKGGLKGR